MPRFGLDSTPRWDKTPSAVRSAALRTQANAGFPPMNLTVEERTTLIARIVELLRGDDVPCHVRSAALTLVGWLARRHDAEKPCTCGLVEARKQSMKVAQGRR